MMIKHGYVLLLALVMAAKGTSFIFSKMLLTHMGTFNVLALRFLLAFVLLAIVFRKVLARASRRTWWTGAIVGALYFAVMVLELTALTMADSGAVALVEHTSIVMVPLATAFMAKQKPQRIVLISAVVALVGVGLLTAPRGGFSHGYIIAVVGAVAYTIAILATDRWVVSPEQGLCIGIIQLGSLGGLALLASFLLETPELPHSAGQWAMIAMLVIVCTAFGFTGQSVAQARVSAEHTGLLAALNPTVAAILGAMVLHEHFGMIGVLGVVLILIAITLPYLTSRS